MMRAITTPSQEPESLREREAWNGLSVVAGSSFAQGLFRTRSFYLTIQ